RTTTLESELSDGIPDCPADNDTRSGRRAIGCALIVQRVSDAVSERRELPHLCGRSARARRRRRPVAPVPRVAAPGRTIRGIAPLFLVIRLVVDGTSDAKRSLGLF